MIAHTIQLALAPVFMLVAIGNILNLLSSRLARVVDRARHLQARHAGTEGHEHDMVVTEIRLVDRRIILVTRAIRLLVMAGIAIGTTVAALFIEQLAGYPLAWVVSAFFLIAVTLLMWALSLFLLETQVATAAIRIPRDYLEQEREL